MRMEYEKVELVMRIISQDGYYDLPYERTGQNTVIVANNGKEENNESK